MPNTSPFAAGFPLGRSGILDGPAGVAVRLLPDLAMIGITARRGGAVALEAATRAHLGLDLPIGPTRRSLDGLTLLGLGPGRWMLVRDSADGAAIDAALGSHAAIVDLSDAYSALVLSGPKSRAVLAKGLPLDLDPARFRIESVATSVIDQVPALIWRRADADSFVIAVPRSLAVSFAAWLLAAAAPFGCLREA